MKNKFLLAFVLIIFIGIVGSWISSESSIPGPNQAAATQRAAATLNTFYSSQFTGTAIFQQTTVASSQLQATLFAEQVQATQSAGLVRATQAAQNAQTTATAQVAGTQVAIAVVQTNQVVAQTANAIQYQADRQRVDLQTSQMLNTILGWGILVMILVILALLGWVAWQLLPAEWIHRKTVMEPRLPFWPAQVGNGSPIQGVPITGSLPHETYPPENGSARQAIPAMARWRVVVEDWPGGSLPLGMSFAGLVTLNPETDPHLLIAGSPGSGKTYFVLRPLIAAALTSGWQAVILDRNDEDYAVLRAHPNAHMVLIGQNNPVDLVETLRRLYAEMMVRIHAFEDSAEGEPPFWPRCLVAVEGFDGALRSLSSFFDRDDLWRYTRLIMAEGHKVGIHLAIVFQNPLLGELDLRIRRFASPVCLQVRDSAESRLILNLPGAETLCPRQFMAILDGELVHGLGFAPEDRDLVDFLESHPQLPLPTPAWLSPLRQTDGENPAGS